MFERDQSREWPLVIFTMSLQLACGLAMVTTLFDLKASSAEVAAMCPLGVVMFPVLAVGILASILHLGQRHSAWKSFLNLPHSRLSVEVLLTLLFAFATLVDSAFWWSGRTEFRFLLGGGTVIIGLATVVSSAAVYMVETQPMWNSAWLPTSFLSTVLLAAGIFGTRCAVSIAGGPLLRLFWGMTAVGSILSFASAFWMRNLFSRLARGRSISIRLPLLPDRRNLSSWLSFGLYVLLTGVLPVALAIGLWPWRSAPVDVSVHLVWAGFVAILFGTALGRSLMYSTGTALSHF